MLYVNNASWHVCINLLANVAMLAAPILYVFCDLIDSTKYTLEALAAAVFLHA